MNTQSMGPQLQLAPDAEHGDRYLDVVMIKENEKGQLENFLNNQDGENTENTFNPIKARHIKIRSQQPIHIDDKLYQMDDPGDQWMEIRLLPQPIQILNA
jgi:diacylglycerol kinase (ATP)